MKWWFEIIIKKASFKLYLFLVFFSSKYLSFHHDDKKKKDFSYVIEGSMAQIKRWFFDFIHWMLPCAPSISYACLSLTMNIGGSLILYNQHHLGQSTLVNYIAQQNTMMMLIS
jgi:hypothetical protein